MKERLNSIKAIGVLVQWFKDLAALVFEIVQAIPLMWNIAWATAMILIAVCLGIIILILIYKQNPRTLSFWHTYPLEGHVSSVCTDIFENMRLVAGLDKASVSGDWLGQSSRFSQGYANVMAAAKQLIVDPMDTGFRTYTDDPFQGDALKSLNAYFVFHDSFTNWGFLSKSDLRNNMPEVNNEDGDPDRAPFYHNIIKPMKQLHEAVTALSEQLHGAGDLAKVVYGANNDPKSFETRNAVKQLTPAKVRFVTIVHELRMMLDQREDITTMFKTRRPNLPMAIWTVYWWPYAKNMIMQRIPGYWMRFPKKYVSTMGGLFQGWAKLGAMFMNIPCILAFSDPEERARKCGEVSVDEFTIGGSSSSSSSSGDPEVREEFLGGLMKALKGILKFIMNLMAMSVAVATLFAQFPIDPVGTIVKLLVILIGVVVGIILVLWWILMTVTGIIFVIIFALTNISTIGGGILYTILLIWLVLIMTIPYFGLWLVDMPTGGAVVSMMRCENAPHAWYDTPSWVDNNLYNRLGMMCLRSCPKRYKPTSSGCCCDRLPNYMPSYCPQQQTYRIYRQLASSTNPEVFENYTPDGVFKKLSVTEKQSFIGKAFTEKMTWYQRCYRVMGSYDFLNRHLCDNIDRLGLPVDVAMRLGVTCRECYCRHKPSRGETAEMMGSGLTGNHQSQAPGGGNKSACARIDAFLETVEVKGNGLDMAASPASKLLSRTLLIAIIALTIVIAMLSLAEAGKALFE